MDHYVTGAAIRQLREKQRLTQAELGALLHVTDKAVSRWETGRGLPDLTLIEPLAQALRVSVPELLSGRAIVNTNRAANLLRTRLHVCPLCGNVIVSAGEVLVSCCGIALPALEAEAPDEEHALQVEVSDGDWYVHTGHPMAKDHHLSFLAFVTGDGVDLRALYPESAAEARFPRRGPGWLYACCNRHGLFRQRLG